MKNRPTTRLPTRRPYMSGKTTSTVSMSLLTTRRLSSLRSIRPCIVTSLADVDIHSLPLGIVIEGLEAELAAEAGALHAAERTFEVHAAAGVDREVARFHGPRDAHRAGDVARPY